MNLKQIFDLISPIEGVELKAESEFISVSSMSLLIVAEKFKNDSSLDFDFLMCITAIDDGNSKNFMVAYNYHSNRHNHSVEVRVSVTDGEFIDSKSFILFVLPINDPPVLEDIENQIELPVIYNETITKIKPETKLQEIVIIQNPGPMPLTMGRQCN